MQWSARSFWAKVLGTIVMVGGGCIDGFYQGLSISLLYTPTGNQIELDAREIRENWVRGPLLVLIALAAMVWYNIETVSFFLYPKIVKFILISLLLVLMFL